jgi:hypothetical protein
MVNTVLSWSQAVEGYDLFNTMQCKGNLQAANEAKDKARSTLCPKVGAECDAIFVRSSPMNGQSTCRAVREFEFYSKSNSWRSLLGMPGIPDA